MGGSSPGPVAPKERSGAERGEALGTTKEVLGFIIDLDFKDLLGFPLLLLWISWDFYQDFYYDFDSILIRFDLDSI